MHTPAIHSRDHSTAHGKGAHSRRCRTAKRREWEGANLARGNVDQGQVDHFYYYYIYASGARPLCLGHRALSSSILDSSKHLIRPESRLSPSRQVPESTPSESSRSFNPTRNDYLRLEHRPFSYASSHSGNTVTECGAFYDSMRVLAPRPSRCIARHRSFIPLRSPCRGSSLGSSLCPCLGLAEHIPNICPLPSFQVMPQSITSFLSTFQLQTAVSLRMASQECRCR